MKEIILPNNRGTTHVCVGEDETWRLEKIFYRCGVDQNQYDLFYKDKNVSKDAWWDWIDGPMGSPYRFVRKSWLDRTKVLFTFKYHDMGISETLKREIIFFL